MADFSEINQEINEQINTNGQSAITGAKLNEVLRDMISSVDENKMDMVEIDTVPTEDSTNPVESGGVYDALQGKVNVIKVFGIQNLTSEQVNSLRVGDVVVDVINKTNKAYTVSTENAGNVDLVMVSESTIIVCRYRGRVYQDTVEIDIAQKASEFVEGNVVSFDENGNLSDRGIASSDVATQSTTPKIYTCSYIDQLTSEQVEALKIGDIVVADHSDYGFLSAYNVTYKDDGECWIETPFNGDGYQVTYAVSNDDWSYVSTEVVSLSDYMGKKSNATVGNFSSFTSSGDVADSGYKPSDFATSAQGAKADTAYQKPSTGIPASDLAGGVIPDVSQFITKSVNDLTNYYLKSETYTQTEVNALIGAIQQFHYEIYATLPQTGQGNVLYLIGPTGSGTDKYEEYVYANNAFVKIGDTSIDLSGYVTTSALNTALADYTTTANLTTLLAGKQDTISDLATIRSGAALGATAYQKPSTGIPASDLASGVIPDISGKEDTSNKVTSFQTTPDDTHYPSEKLVKDSLDDKLDISDVEEVSAVDVDNTPTASSANLVTSGGVYSGIHPTLGTSMPSGGFLPNVVYNLSSVVTGTVTWTMAAATDNTIANIWHWCFTTDSTAPTITWPSAILEWNGGSAPTINASKRYEVNVMDGVACILETDIPT